MDWGEDGKEEVGVDLISTSVTVELLCYTVSMRMRTLIHLASKCFHDRFDDPVDHPAWHNVSSARKCIGPVAEEGI